MRTSPPAAAPTRIPEDPLEVDPASSPSATSPLSISPVTVATALGCEVGDERDGKDGALGFIVGLAVGLTIGFAVRMMIVVLVSSTVAPVSLWTVAVNVGSDNAASTSLLNVLASASEFTAMTSKSAVQV
jgi:hypothetical protein